MRQGGGEDCWPEVPAPNKKWDMPDLMSRAEGDLHKFDS